MSNKASAWAYEQVIKPSSLKFLLVALSDHEGGNGEVYPSVAALVAKTCQDRKTVIGGITELIARGYIEDTGKRVGRTGQVRVLRLIGYLSEVELTRNQPFRVSARRAAALAKHPENGTVSAGHNGPEFGTLQATDGDADSAIDDDGKGAEFGTGTENGTVPFFPAKGPVFPRKEYRKRDTEPSGNQKGTSERERTRADGGGGEGVQTPDQVPRETSSASALDAWRDDDRCNPKAMEHWIRHCAELTPPKFLTGSMRIAAAGIIADWGDFDVQLQGVLWCSANGFRNLRAGIGDQARSDADTGDIAEHLANLRAGTAA